MSKQCALAAKKTNSILQSVASRSREASSLLSPGERHPSAVSSAGLPCTKQTQAYRSESSTGPRKLLKDWSIFHMRRHWESWDYSDCRKESSGESYLCK